MVELFCSIVGAPESAFPVNIDADQTVGDLKDAIWLDNKNNLKDVDAKKLQLFPVKTTTGAWLRDDDPAALKLNVGVIHPDIQTMTDVEQLEATWEIKDVLAVNNMTERFGCAPTSRQIHVLVVVPRKSELGWQSARLRPHIYDPGAKYFLLEKEVMDDSGLPPSRLMLYCRPMFHKQIEFMLKNVLEEGHLGWILGSPGTGKSATAMAFALTVDRRAWVVTWIHVDKYLGWRCVRLVGDERKTRVIDITELKQVLEFGDDTKHHLVLVDDWTAADSFTDLTVMCTEWFLQKDIVMKRRLAFICSVADRGKISDNLELMTRAMECKLWSWTLDEYLEATSNDDIFNNVFPYLDASGLSSADRSTIVQTKYYYAGGSCRYMFCFSTARVMEKLSHAVDSLDVASVAITGPRSSLSLNCVFAMFKGTSGVSTVLHVVSGYAAATIGIRCSPEIIKRFMNTNQGSSNPVLNGWILEMIFFSSIREGSLDMVDAAGNKTGNWMKGTLVVSDGVPSLPADRHIWIKPEKWNKGGYDAIMVDKGKRQVQMVQVTSSHTHAFHINYFNSWLKALSESRESFKIQALDIIFVVESGKLKDFVISTVTGQGKLKSFGWEPFKEKDRVKVVGIRRREDGTLSQMCANAFQLHGITMRSC